MKAQLIAFGLFLAATPAGASISTDGATPFDLTPQPAAFASEPAVEPDPGCGKPRRMLIILRDPSGAVVAMGVAEVTAPC